MSMRCWAHSHARLCLCGEACILGSVATCMQFSFVGQGACRAAWMHNLILKVGEALLLGEVEEPTSCAEVWRGQRVRMWWTVSLALLTTRDNLSGLTDLTCQFPWPHWPSSAHGTACACALAGHTCTALT